MKFGRGVWQPALSAPATTALIALVGLAQNAGDPIQRGFMNPSDSAKPRVWWHWMNGNISDGEIYWVNNRSAAV